MCARYNKRFYKKRSYKRGSLSTRKIFGSKSAKSQARQIYALRKRINYVSKVCKPETKVYQGSNISLNFESSQLTNTYKIQYFNGPTRGTGDDNFTGNKVRSIALNVYTTLEYYNSSDTGYHNTESAGSPFRIIILQRKKSSNNEDLTLGDVLSSYGGSGGNYSMQAVCPLVRGITDNFKVLCDKRFVFTTSNNQRILRLKVKPNNLRWDNDGIANGFIVLYISAGLHYDANFIEHIEGYSRIDYIYADN